MQRIKKVLKRVGVVMLVVLGILALPIVDEGLSAWKDFIHCKLRRNEPVRFPWVVDEK